jgi:mRNA-degrading endonuclease toxin of MazEF toxin-antitoxin module
MKTVLVVALVAAVVALIFFVRRNGPRRGEIWWADVPYADGTGSKVRPCLVVGRRLGGIVVLKITSQDKSHRRDHVLIPTKGWDPRAQHDSYLNVREPLTVRRSAFERRAGTRDPEIMKRLKTRQQ